MHHPDGNDPTPDRATPDQGDLFAQPVDDPPASGPTEAEKFSAYHAANPIVLETLIREARRWMAERPGAPLGIDLLIGRVRWVLTMQLQKDGAGFRINDHFNPAYARLVMHYAPDTRGLFQLRRTRWADDYLDALRERERQAA